jgi:hypothetical protein
VNQTTDSFKIFAAWLAALFLTALGAQLWIVWLYGSPLPMWDQWYEASDFFKPWVTGHLKWTDFFAAHNEHRIFATRLLDVSLIWLNGRWEPLLQMAVNAFIHAAFACGLAFCLWDLLGRANGWLVCCLLAPFFALPYAGENATWGFNSQDYFVNIFALIAIVGLGFGKVGGWRWWIGLAAAILGLFSMASGLLAPVAVGGLIVLRALKDRRLEKGNLIALIVCVAVVVAGAMLKGTKEQDRAFQAHSFLEFTAALTRNLSWPFYNAPFMPCLIMIPLALLLAFYLRPKFPEPRAAEFLLVLALWSALQSVAMAYGRANYGGNIFPVSRYTDWFNVFVIAAVFAAVLLVQLQERNQFRNALLALIFIGGIFCGVIHISPIVVNGLLAPTRMWNLAAEERVERFLATGNEQDFLERPTVRPDPQLALAVLHDSRLQTILPVSCLPLSPTPKPGRLAGLTQWLLTHSFAILCAGLILFIGLCGYGLVRGGALGIPALGIPIMSLPGIFVLSTGLVALCVVWSNRSVTRESVEYDLQRQIAANFKAAGNLKRAAIHEQKAEQLKQFAN